jgi:hypothetical protein
MKTPRLRTWFAGCFSVALHALALLWVAGGVGPSHPPKKVEVTKTEGQVVFLEATAAPPDKPATPQRPVATTRPPELAPQAAPRSDAPPHLGVAAPDTERSPTFMEAPPAPTQQEWALAANYSLKNSKRYRHTWAQQVRSMMGTAFEGVDQGVVRFRIEIGPDGTLVRLDTLWTTSPKAEALAREAVSHMPPLPPTPTGKPLIFEKTISFQPFSQDDAPYYKDDCLPDPPGFRNPFVLIGQSAPVRAQPAAVEPLDPQALEECLKQLPPDSFEGEAAHDQRQLKQWRSDKLGR